MQTEATRYSDIGADILLERPGHCNRPQVAVRSAYGPFYELRRRAL